MATEISPLIAIKKYFEHEGDSSIPADERKVPVSELQSFKKEDCSPEELAELGQQAVNRLNELGEDYVLKQ